MNEIKRWRGLKRLLQDAVVHGATAIEQVHLKTAERPFEVLKRIPPLEASVSDVRAIHDTLVSTAYGSVR